MLKKRSWWRWALVFVVIIVLGGWFIHNSTQLPDRSAYLAEDLTSVEWQKRFGAPYQIALVNHEEWIADPKSLALRAAGYPDEDNIPPGSVTTFSSELGKLIFIISSGPAMDDSIGLIERRVDLIQQDSHWQVEWAGARWQCRRALFQWGWTTRRCS